MNSTTYKYAKLSKLSQSYCFACKKGDIDTLIQDLHIETPFHILYMSKNEQQLQSASFFVASAENRFHERSIDYYDWRQITRILLIYAIHRKYAKEIRMAIKEHWLQELIVWFQNCQQQPVTWQSYYHRVDVVYHVDKKTFEWQEHYFTS